MTKSQNYRFLVLFQTGKQMIFRALNYKFNNFSPHLKGIHQKRYYTHLKQVFNVISYILLSLAYSTMLIFFFTFHKNMYSFKIVIAKVQQSEVIMMIFLR